MTPIGWETSLAITAVLATTTIFRRLGWSSGNSVKICATIIVAFLIVGGAVAGYHIIMKLQAVLTWITGILTVIYLVMAVSHINWHTATSLPAASFPAFVGALTLIMTGTGWAGQILPPTGHATSRAHLPGSPSPSGMSLGPLCRSSSSLPVDCY